MINFRKTTLAVCLLIPGLALADINPGDMLGHSGPDVRATLEGMGYTVTEIEVEDDEIEVEAMFDGRAFEIEVSPKTGMVLEAKLDDDHDDSDSDDD
jgi:hypothetical protein